MGDRYDRIVIPATVEFVWLFARLVVMTSKKEKNCRSFSYVVSRQCLTHLKLGGERQVRLDYIFSRTYEIGFLCTFPTVSSARSLRLTLLFCECQFPSCWFRLPSCRIPSHRDLFIWIGFLMHANLYACVKAWRKHLEQREPVHRVEGRSPVAEGARGGRAVG